MSDDGEKVRFLTIKDNRKYEAGKLYGIFKFGDKYLAEIPMADFGLIPKESREEEEKGENLEKPKRAKKIEDLDDEQEERFSPRKVLMKQAEEEEENED